MKVKLPYWMKTFLTIVLPGLIICLGEMMYECIYLTYKEGPQMIGFSLIHTRPALFFFMLLSYWASTIWSLVYIIWLIKIKIKKKKPDLSWIYISTVSIVVFIALLEPISTFLGQFHE
jgi:hypothetical protein